MPQHLVMITGPDHGSHIVLDNAEIVLIGRGEMCGVRLSDPSASRVHCRVTSAEGRVFLEDAGSRWGTLVNGAPVQSQELTTGDRITIGDSEIELQTLEPDAVTVPPKRRRILADVEASNGETSRVESPESKVQSRETRRSRRPSPLTPRLSPLAPRPSSPIRLRSGCGISSARSLNVFASAALSRGLAAASFSARSMRPKIARSH